MRYVRKYAAERTSLWLYTVTWCYLRYKAHHISISNLSALLYPQLNSIWKEPSRNLNNSSKATSPRNTYAFWLLPCITSATPIFLMRSLASMQQRGVQLADMQKSCHMVYGDPIFSPGRWQSSISPNVKPIRSRSQLTVGCVYMGLDSIE